MGAGPIVKRAQTRERGPKSAPAELIIIFTTLETVASPGDLVTINGWGWVYGRLLSCSETVQRNRCPFIVYLGKRKKKSQLVFLYNLARNDAQMDSPMFPFKANEDVLLFQVDDDPLDNFYPEVILNSPPPVVSPVIVLFKNDFLFSHTWTWYSPYKSKPCECCSTTQGGQDFLACCVVCWCLADDDSSYQDSESSSINSTNVTVMDLN